MQSLETEVHRVTAFKCSASETNNLKSLSSCGQWGWWRWWM